MKKVSTDRFAIVKKGGQYVKPFLDDSPYLLFRTKKDAKKCILMNLPRDYTVVKVRVIIEPLSI